MDEYMVLKNSNVISGPVPLPEEDALIIYYRTLTQQNDAAQREMQDELVGEMPYFDETVRLVRVVRSTRTTLKMQVWVENVGG